MNDMQKIFTYLRNVTLLITATFYFQQVYAQTPVKATLIDVETNEPLVGASVRIKNNDKKATLSNALGVFTITAAASDVLVISYLGYTSKEVAVKDIKDGIISLNGNPADLQEVVVIGYGAVKKADLTGSVAEVRMDDLNKAPVASFDQALAGRVAGVKVSSNEGQPGAEMNIVIRGGNSLTQSNSPLYVVDGFPIEDFTSAALNMDDIASINVLKDASATAIYGSRGANGVIIIETKKGKIGRSVIAYNVTAGVLEVTQRMKLMTPYEFVKYELERSPAAMTEVYLTKPEKTLEDYRNVEGIDWQEMLFQTAPMQTHNVSVSGGNKTRQYSISGSIFDQEGVIINSGYSRAQGRISLSEKVNDKLSVDVNVNFSKDKNTGQIASAQQSSSSAYSTFLMYGVWGYRPLVTGDGQFDIINDLFDPEANDTRVNPIISTENEFRRQLRSNLIANAHAKYNFTPDLYLDVRGGVNLRTTENQGFYNSNTRAGFLAPTNLNGVNGLLSTGNLDNWVNENTLTYKKKINKENAIDFLAGFTLQQTSTKNYGFRVVNIPNEDLGLSGMDEGIPFSTSSLRSSNMLMSYLGRVNYSYRGKYLLTASMRADGSSKFAPGKRWGYFPSGAFAWQMGRENFIKDSKVISNAKLRMSIGATGNNRIGDDERFSALRLPAFDYYSFGNETPTPGLTIGDFGNPDLKWETTVQADLGYDISFFKNRVNLTVDVYRKTTKDLLLRANVPSSSGVPNIFKNVGKIQNQGLEISLGTTNIETKSFKWNTDFNISFNNNKILALAEGEESILSTVNWTGNYNNVFLYMGKIGQPAAAFYGYVWDGNYQFEDFDQSGTTYTLKNTVPSNGAVRSTIKPGDVKYVDQNNDGIVNDLDRVAIGRAIPLHTGGFNNNFAYKGFSLNVFFQWSAGNEIYNANRLMFEGNTFNRSGLNQFASYNNRWTPDNPTNDYIRAGGQGPANVYSSNNIEDGSFIRLKTIQLAYSLPLAFLRKIKVQRLEINASAQNLYAWTNYSGMDPEVSVRNTTLTPGFDYSAYPVSRTIIFGLKASL